MPTPDSVQVRLSLGVFSATGSWSPNRVELEAAWELYVELVTRSGVVQLADDQGVLREVLTSHYSLFETFRHVLRARGPDLAKPTSANEYNLAYIAIAVLNGVLRPLLGEWHPRLADWEARRTDASVGEHERLWDDHEAMRQALLEAGGELDEFARLLADACGIDHLLDLE